MAGAALVVLAQGKEAERGRRPAGRGAGSPGRRRWTSSSRRHQEDVRLIPATAPSPDRQRPPEGRLLLSPSAPNSASQHPHRPARHGAAGPARNSRARASASRTRTAVRKASCSGLGRGAEHLGTSSTSCRRRARPSPRSCRAASASARSSVTPTASSASSRSGGGGHSPSPSSSSASMCGSSKKWPGALDLLWVMVMPFCSCSLFTSAVVSAGGATRSAEPLMIRPEDGQGARNEKSYMLAGGRPR